MVRKPKDNPRNYPWLGRVFLWVDRPGSVSKLIWALAAACLLLVLADFTYDKYGNFAVDYVPGFYGAFGFVMFSAVVLGAKALRVWIKHGVKTIMRRTL